MANSDSVHVVCASCRTTNRLPAARLGQGPRCGRCKLPLFNGEPAVLDRAGFGAQIDASDIPVVVDFWAPWCTPCRMVAPTLDKLAKELAGKMLIAKVNTDDNPLWAQKFNVQGIPTMLFVSGGKVVHQQVGALPEPMLRSVVDQFLGVVNEGE